MPAETVALRGARGLGIAAPTLSGYTLDYAIAHLDRRDAAALSWAMPVQLDTFARPGWPAFLVDLLPQGYGRQELLRQLGVGETTGAEADWQLSVCGAGNPIGHLRVREAYDWLGQRSSSARAPCSPSMKSPRGVIH